VNALFVRAGGKSLYKEQIVPKNAKSFDLCVEYYEEYPDQYIVKMPMITPITVYILRYTNFVNAMPVFHTKPPISGELYSSVNVNPSDEMFRVGEIYDVPSEMHKFKVFGGIPNGH
jgi:hypothetical protein